MTDAKPEFVPYRGIQYDAETMENRSQTFYEYMRLRRTVREFSDRGVPRSVIEQIVKTASTAPSGAHKQPWTFCVVTNPRIKSQIREAAEKEEYENYHGRMSEAWLEDLKTFGTDHIKPFLEIAPYLIIVFKKAYDLGPDGEKQKNYYVNESVGLACGMLLAAIHNAGLVAVTHTPSPMNFLQQVLGRPANERPFLLIPVGYPATDVEVPNIERKPLSQISSWYE